MINYLSKYCILTKEKEEIVTKATILKAYKKGDKLLEEGEFSKESYFILKGCLISYSMDDGEQKVLDIFVEEQPVLPLGYRKEVPSQHYLQCLEDTLVSVNSPEYEKEMFEKYPAFESICRIMAEVMMTNYQESFAYYKLTSAEDRYLTLLKNRPSLAQRVPQYLLASYLGIKPESLSRIRRRLLTK